MHTILYILYTYLLYLSTNLSSVNGQNEEYYLDYDRVISDHNFTDLHKYDKTTLFSSSISLNQHITNVSQIIIQRDHPLNTSILISVNVCTPDKLDTAIVLRINNTVNKNFTFLIPSSGCYDATIILPISGVFKKNQNYNMNITLYTIRNDEPFAFTNNDISKQFIVSFVNDIGQIDITHVTPSIQLFKRLNPSHISTSSRLISSSSTGSNSVTSSFSTGSLTSVNMITSSSTSSNVMSASSTISSTGLNIITSSSTLSSTSSNSNTTSLATTFDNDDNNSKQNNYNPISILSDKLHIPNYISIIIVTAISFFILVLFVMLSIKMFNRYNESYDYLDDFDDALLCNDFYQLNKLCESQSEWQINPCASIHSRTTIHSFDSYDP